MSQPELDVDLLESLNATCRRVMERVRTTGAPTDALAQAQAALEKVEALLAPHAHPGPFAQTSFEGAAPHLDSDFSDPMAVFPYSPMVGARNPIAPPVEFHVEDGVVHGRVCFGPLYAGPPRSVHGGVIAAVLDELLGSVNMVHGVGAFTGTLTVRYRAPTPLHEPVRLEGHQAGTEGRKSFARGSMWCGDTLTAEAEGVFIRPPKGEWRLSGDVG
jgi:acyl-coenzyme A thioesterase PaaI-like protein